MLPRTTPVCCLFVLVLPHYSSAVNVDFVVDQNRESYREAFTSPAAVSYMDVYMSRFRTNMAALFKAGANGFSYAGLNFPVLGKPHITSAWGVNAGLGFYQKDKTAVGLKIVDDGSSAGIDLCFFRDVKVNVTDDSGLDQTSLGQLKAVGIEKGDPQLAPP